MTFKPAIWYPIAVVLSVVNLFAAGLAARAGESWHAMTHAALAVAFGLWAQRLRPRPGAGGAAGAGELEARLDALEFEVGGLRQELSEAQERLDFAERMLAKGAESRRVGPEH